MTRPSPFAARLFALQISDRPEDAEELDFLEKWQLWKVGSGVKVFDAKRASERNRQLISHHRMLVQKEKRKYEH